MPARDQSIAAQKPLRVGLCGMGTVGSQVVALFRRNQTLIDNRAGRHVQLTHIASRRTNQKIDGVIIEPDIFAIASNPEIDVCIELIGECTTAFTLLKKAIHHGKHIVTANKALLYAHGDTLFSTCEQKGVSLLYEAAVASAIPIVNILCTSFAANRITRIRGILNGTSNYILSAMSAGKRFDDALTHAKAMGFAEADPSLDIDGLDALHKITLLARLAFGHIAQLPPPTHAESIRSIEAADIACAQEMGYRIKPLASASYDAQGVSLHTYPVLLPTDHPLAHVNDELNIIQVDADGAGSSWYSGYGAGGAPTASAVISDVITLAKERAPLTQSAHFQTKLPLIAETQNNYYVRTTHTPAADKKIATIFNAVGGHKMIGTKTYSVWRLNNIKDLSQIFRNISTHVSCQPVCLRMMD